MASAAARSRTHRILSVLASNEELTIVLVETELAEMPNSVDGMSQHATTRHVKA
jgi:hypothetical protein